MAAKPCKLQQVTQTRRGGGSARGSCQTPKTQAHTVVGLRRAQMPVTTRFSTTPRTCRCRYTVDTGAGTPAGAGTPWTPWTPWTPHLQVQVHRGHRCRYTCRCRYTVDTAPAGAGTPWTRAAASTALGDAAPASQPPRSSGYNWQVVQTGAAVPSPAAHHDHPCSATLASVM